MALEILKPTIYTNTQLAVARNALYKVIRCSPRFHGYTPQEIAEYSLRVIDDLQVKGEELLNES